MSSRLELAEMLGDLMLVVRQSVDQPHGRPPDPETRKLAGDACVALCDGDKDKARTLWKLIADRLGYMPEAAAVALIYATKTNLVPDVEGPVPQ